MALLSSVTLPRQSNPGRYGFDGAARLINCHSEDMGEEGRARWPIYTNAGWDTFVALTAQGAIRAALVLNDALYVVAGQSACKIATDGSFTVIGTVGGPDLTKVVTMSRNRKVTPQICITVDNFVYLIESDVLTTVTDADLQPDVNSAVGLDGYFVLFCDSGKFQLTSIDEGSTIAALDFSTASADPDGGTICAVRNRDLVLLGPNSIEFWQDTGGTFPFTRTTSAVGAHAGILAARSVSNVGDTLAYVATDKTVRILDGYTPKRISTHAVERSINAETDPAAITSLSWTYEGHTRYEISGTNFTWTYDMATGAWTEAKSYDLNRSRASVYIEFDGKHLFGDYEDGRIYDRSNDHLSEAGSPIVGEVWIAAMHDNPNRIKINALYIDVMTGAAPTATMEPVLMLDWSDDGGKTFGSQRMLSLRKQGDRQKSVKTFRLGAPKEIGRVFRLSWSAASATCILGVRPEVEGLMVNGN